MKRLLMVAFHFPPLAGSSGIQRTLSFARHLPACGWEPLILSAHPRAYERVSNDLLKEVGPGTVVERTFALDSARHLAILGRYPGFAARPDRWLTWWLGAVPGGLAMIRKYRPDAIWSTYPIATAHAIGHTLHRLSGLPWVADFRDPMAQDGYPEDPRTWKSFERIERRAVHAASACIFVTSGAARMYRERYSGHPGARFTVIENGYEEEIFAPVQDSPAGGPLVSGSVTLLHSGIVYPSERDPTRFFEALARMRENGELKPGELRVRLRAPGNEAFLSRLIARYQVDGIVELAPPIAYREALLEMMRADGLLVLQAANCNDQIPAKVYEYVRSGRPMIALTDPAGDTAGVLRRAGLTDIAPLDAPAAIASALRTFLDRIARGNAALPERAFVEGASRANRTRELAQLLDRLPVQRT